MTRIFHIFKLRYYTIAKTQRQVMRPIDWLKKDIPHGCQRQQGLSRLILWIFCCALDNLSDKFAFPYVFSRKFMHVLTVILRCDIALLWRIISR